VGVAYQLFSVPKKLTPDISAKNLKAVPPYLGEPPFCYQHEERTSAKCYARKRNTVC